MIRRILRCYETESSEGYEATLAITGVGEIDAALDAISYVGGVVTDIEPVRPGVFEVLGLVKVKDLENLKNLVEAGWEWGPEPDIPYATAIQLDMGQGEQVTTIILPGEFARNVYTSIANQLITIESKNPVF